MKQHKCGFLQSSYALIACNKRLRM